MRVGMARECSGAFRRAGGAARACAHVAGAKCNLALGGSRREVAATARANALEEIVAAMAVYKEECGVLRARLAEARTSASGASAAHAKEMGALSTEVIELRMQLERTFQQSLVEMDDAYRARVLESVADESRNAVERNKSLRAELAARESGIKARAACAFANALANERAGAHRSCSRSTRRWRRRTRSCRRVRTLARPRAGCVTPARATPDRPRARDGASDRCACLARAWDSAACLTPPTPPCDAALAARSGAARRAARDASERAAVRSRRSGSLAIGHCAWCAPTQSTEAEAGSAAATRARVAGLEVCACCSVHQSA